MNRFRFLLRRMGCLVASMTVAFGHDLSRIPPELLLDGPVTPVHSHVRTMAAATPGPGASRSKSTGSASDAPTQAEPFLAFSPRVHVRWDDGFLYVENRGMPAHGMMVGINAWQQQVPLPQDYTGDNAWRIPRHPVPATQPRSIRNQFLRGAIAVAVNGIPIFNPQNNRGEISNDIGELDQWGGHCGRADDYHYHAAPFHLQQAVGRSRPIAFALDGYPIYGLEEPDGTSTGKLDEFHGHETAALGYHYHASRTYPFVQGGFHGEVVEREGQVDPQPRARPVRPSLTPLRGARITAFSADESARKYELGYTVGGRPGSVAYEQSAEGVWTFLYRHPDGSERRELHRAGSTPSEGPRRAPREGPGRSVGTPPSAGAPDAASRPAPRRSGRLHLISPAFAEGGELPVEFTGDGAGVSPPLEWTGMPEGTREWVVLMHHLDPQGKTKWYWSVRGIPASARGLPKGGGGIGVLGNNSVNRKNAYAPPHSKGPGAKTYFLTLYALSGPPRIPESVSDINRDGLLEAMEGLVLDTAELAVVATRNADSRDSQDARNPRRDRNTPESQPR